MSGECPANLASHAPSLCILGLVVRREWSGGVSDSQCLSSRDAFLGAPAARRLPRFPVSLVSTAGPRALPLPARCGTQFDSRHRDSGRRPPVRLRYASSSRDTGKSETPTCAGGQRPKETCTGVRIGKRGSPERNFLLFITRKRQSFTAIKLAALRYRCRTLAFTSLGGAY